jgi:hypothetical protein
VRLTAGVVAAIVSLAPPETAAAQATTPLPASEQPLRGALSLAPGATCLDPGRVEAQVEAWLGRDRIPADVRVDVHGSDRDPRAVEFRIWRGGKPHDRRFDRLPESCDDATAVLGLAIALAIDASVLAGAFAPPPVVAPPKRLVSIEVGTGIEVVPGTSVGASVGVEYGVTEWLSGRVEVGTQFSLDNPIQGTSGVFDAALVDGAPQICAGGEVTPSVRLELCSGAGFGVLHAQGHGFEPSRSATGFWMVAQGGLRLVATAGISWVLDVEGVFPLYVPAFRAENAQGVPLYRDLNPPGALLSAGPVFFF